MLHVLSNHFLAHPTLYHVTVVCKQYSGYFGVMDW
jgi:hypothetical protein